MGHNGWVNNALKIGVSGQKYHGPYSDNMDDVRTYNTSGELFRYFTPMETGTCTLTFDLLSICLTEESDNIGIIAGTKIFGISLLDFTKEYNSTLYRWPINSDLATIVDGSFCGDSVRTNNFQCQTSNGFYPTCCFDCRQYVWYQKIERSFEVIKNTPFAIYFIAITSLNAEYVGFTNIKLNCIWPTNKPTTTPSISPTIEPTLVTQYPTNQPTKNTKIPSKNTLPPSTTEPTIMTNHPTTQTIQPSLSTNIPTSTPTITPTNTSDTPTKTPSTLPTNLPTIQTINPSTADPTKSPTEIPSLYIAPKPIVGSSIYAAFNSDTWNWKPNLFDLINIIGLFAGLFWIIYIYFKFLYPFKRDDKLDTGLLTYKGYLLLTIIPVFEIITCIFWLINGEEFISFYVNWTSILFVFLPYFSLWIFAFIIYYQFSNIINKITYNISDIYNKDIKAEFSIKKVKCHGKFMTIFLFIGMIISYGCSITHINLMWSMPIWFIILIIFNTFILYKLKKSVKALVTLHSESVKMYPGNAKQPGSLHPYNETIGYIHPKSHSSNNSKATNELFGVNWYQLRKFKKIISVMILCYILILILIFYSSYFYGKQSFLFSEPNMNIQYIPISIDIWRCILLCIHFILNIIIAHLYYQAYYEDIFKDAKVCCCGNNNKRSNSIASNHSAQPSIQQKYVEISPNERDTLNNLGNLPQKWLEITNITPGCSQSIREDSDNSDDNNSDNTDGSSGFVVKPAGTGYDISNDYDYDI